MSVMCVRNFGDEKNGAVRGGPLLEKREKWASPGVTLPMLSTATFPAAGCRPPAGISKEDHLRHSLKIYMVILALCAGTVRALETLPLKLIATNPMPRCT